MNKNSVVATKSRLKALYLVYVRGLRVRSVYCMPVLTLLHVMVYSRTWILVP